MMKHGEIRCECGNVFYFQSIRKEIPCMKCGTMHPNNGEPVSEEPSLEEGNQDGTFN